MRMIWEAHLAQLLVCLHGCPLQPVSCSRAILYQTCKAAPVTAGMLHAVYVLSLC